MAIQLKSASLSESFSYICTVDSAVDLDCADFSDKWKRYRDGAGDPPLKQGTEPTVWELTPITDSRLSLKLADMMNTDGTKGRRSWFVATAMYGITGVKNLQDEDGKPIKLEFERSEGYTSVRGDIVALIPPAVLIEIGQVLVTHNVPNQD